MRRSVDLAWCLLSAPILLPLWAILALAIWLDDGTPILFRQTRHGLGRRPFTIVKFRTLRDGRVTRVGSWLRRTGLDETAQWLNVLRGDMSWIGPRPLTEEDLVRLGWDGPLHDPRFRIKPGVTGLAQLFAGTHSGWTRGLDRIYRHRRGARLDTWIVLWSILCCAIGKERGRRLLRRNLSPASRGSSLPAG